MSSGYLKVIFLNFSIFLYTMSILYLLYSYLLTRDLMDAGQDEPSFTFDPRRHCLLESTRNLQLFKNVHQFRLMEMTIFFAQLASLFVYIVICKLFIACKRSFSSPEKLE